MLGNLSEHISNNSFYTFRKEKTELFELRLRRCGLMPVFAALPESVSVALQIMRP